MAMATKHRSPRHCCRHQEAPATWTWWGSQYHSSDPRAAAVYFNYRQVSASMRRAGASRKCAALPTRLWMQRTCQVNRSAWQCGCALPSLSTDNAGASLLFRHLVVYTFR